MSDHDEWAAVVPAKPRTKRGKKPPAVVADNLNAVGAPRFWKWLKDELPQAGIALVVVAVASGVSIYKSRP